MKQVNLCLHAGGQRASLDQISAVALPPQTETYHPISHRVMYDLVREALAGLNMRIVAEEHALAREGQRYFSLLQVANCVEQKDYAYIVGLRNSMDKSFPAGLSVGSQVFVCDNLAFSGEITIARKHTARIETDLPALTARAVGCLATSWNRQNERFDAYRRQELTDGQVHDMVIRALDLGACTTTQIPAILKEWREPAHEEFRACGKTGWRFFNGVTEVLKGGSVFNLPKRTQSLHAILDAACGVTNKVIDVTGTAVDTEVTAQN